MSFYHLIIAAIIAFVAYQMRRPATGTAPALRTAAPLSPNTPASFGAPGVTGQSTALTAAPAGAVTNQPSGAASGVPQFTAQASTVNNPVPGPIAGNYAPFQGGGNPIPGFVSGFRSNYSTGRDLFNPANIARMLKPYNLPGSKQAGGCSGGCNGGCSAGTGGSPSRCSQRNGCPQSTPMPSPNQPINIPPSITVGNHALNGTPPNPMTLASQIQNVNFANGAQAFQTFQAAQSDADENQGGVPAYNFVPY